MIGTLAGAMHKKGNFVNEETGDVVEYDNLVLTILVPIKLGGAYDPVEAVGKTVDNKAKCAFSNISNVFGSDVTGISDIEPFIGSDIEYFYDSSKKLERVWIHD